MNIKQIISRLVREESGQDLIEYALVAALIGLGAVVAMKALASNIEGALTHVGNVLTTDV